MPRDTVVKSQWKSLSPAGGEQAGLFHNEKTPWERGRKPLNDRAIMMFQNGISRGMNGRGRRPGLYRFSKIVSDFLRILAWMPVGQSCHCEERSDEAISVLAGLRLLRALPSQ